MLKYFIGLILLFNPCVSLADQCAEKINEFNCLEYLYNYDGDSITVNIPNVHPLFGEKITIRVGGIDTPEMRTKDACEKALAKKAKAIVKSALINAKHISVSNVERGKYFRIVGDVKADGVDIASLLIKEKLAVRYDGGTKPKIDWCDFK